VLLTPHPLLVPKVLEKSRAIPLLTLSGPAWPIKRVKTELFHRGWYINTLFLLLWSCNESIHFDIIAT